MKSSAEIRKAFLDYFYSKDHEIIPSSSLIPANDPTLLFTNAGMVQFKDIFLGYERRSYQRATSAQRCMRAGGKHNDLENVGYTARHHTFFEMLGNFSFGDYFKREAISYAWDFLTNVLDFPPDKLWVTVFEEDDEAADIWLKEIGINPNRFSRCGSDDNFWSMGDIGPCGPCSEIFYDHGPSVAGGPPGSPDQDGDRYIEIWNLVFMQYNRDEKGQLSSLPKPSVDTGMGLERLAAILQGVHNNYDIDLFRTLIAAITNLPATHSYDLQSPSLRVIADHIRSCTFLIIDGIQPSNEGRGYVLRRIIRRAIRHGHKLGLNTPFFYKLVNPLVEEMGSAYPELIRGQQQAIQVLKLEEERFNETLDHGLKILEQDIVNLLGSEISGGTVFKLYDTFGFPIDLTADIARERGLSIDIAGFDKEMAKQRARAQAASRFKDQNIQLPVNTETKFTGYNTLQGDGAIISLFRIVNDTITPVDQLNMEEEGIVVLNQTPFYAESGGQIGDQGELYTRNSLFSVIDTRKQGYTHLHLGKVVTGILRIGEIIQSQVNANYRVPTKMNHSATHLLHAALREILGHHVAQKGSLVTPDRLRFDFSHSGAITQSQLNEIEQLVNAKIRENLPVETIIMPLQKALDSGVTALFGEKYGESVRVLKMGDFSTELCGGTHIGQTGEINLFKIVSETGIAAGIRRIEALTGKLALDWIEHNEAMLETIASQLKVVPNKISEKILQLQQQIAHQEKELRLLKTKLINSEGTDLSAQAQEIKGMKVLAAFLEEADINHLRSTVDQLKSKLGTAVIVLGSVTENKVILIAGVTKNATQYIKAGDLVNFVAEQTGGRGGGRPDMAQAGGKDPSKLGTALKSVPSWVEKNVSK
ncbi:alanine--tRNA ligase [Candidatus Nitrosacidococcus tergens]|uniref:Alanine--tRNA ligase n=1 Tax=Candidatus Nitrosacidococcus tergens TaxID=553981 RepID=A0A7G1Q9Y0_9GAMM|nr:alanine--tRNA ligase [Candidatus Nitrosacidococcus tergens]CAB1276306.1 alanyl-tRNA synthetase [Candidatus Nitrosacidococcus tergens]